jgi:hypothetical protein
MAAIGGRGGAGDRSGTATESRSVSDLQMPLDRAALSDLVHRYAADDARDRQLLRSSFADIVDIDFSDWDPQVRCRLSADVWTARLREGLGGFDVTHRASSNRLHTPRGDQAECVSYVRAGRTLAGYYENRMRRTDAGRRIERRRLPVTCPRGDYAAFARARRRYPEGLAR